MDGGAADAPKRNNNSINIAPLSFSCHCRYPDTSYECRPIDLRRSVVVTVR